MLAGLAAPEHGVGAADPAAARRSATCRRSPSGAPGETVPAFLARRTGVAPAQAALDAAADALARGRAGADDAYALALDRWLALGGADLEDRAGAVTAELGLRRRPRPRR